MIKEVLIVEGKMDTAAVKRAVDADTIETGGFSLLPYSLKQIEAAYRKRGIIILTDPDRAGESIRHFLTRRFPGAGQAFIPRQAAVANGDIGVEQASPEAIRTALGRVRYSEITRQNAFSMADLFANGLSGTGGAALRRDALGAELGIGYGNAKRFLERLNSYGVTRAEFESALERLATSGRQEKTSG